VAACRRVAHAALRHAATSPGSDSSLFFLTQNEIPHYLNTHLSMAAAYKGPVSLMTERTITHDPCDISIHSSSSKTVILCCVLVLSFLLPEVTVCRHVIFSVNFATYSTHRILAILVTRNKVYKSNGGWIAFFYTSWGQ